jgi:adenosylcobinamide-GDP ribazoletransferase
MAKQAKRRRRGKTNPSVAEPMAINPVEILTDWWNAILIAASVLAERPLALARVPLRAPDKGEVAQAARGFPVVGLAQGLLAALAYAIADGLNLPPFLAAAIAVSVLVFLGGAMAEGGFVRFADAFLKGGTRAQQRKTLAEGPASIYGTAMLVIVLALRIGALTWLAAAGAVAAALAASLAAAAVAIPALLYALPPTTPSGFAASAGAPRWDQLVLSAALGAAIALLFLGPVTGIVALVVGAIGAAKIGWFAKRGPGGVTREILGAAQQSAEIGMLLAIVAMA